MEEQKLTVVKREGNKGSDLTKVRVAGMIPGVFYGAGNESVSVAAKALELRPFIYTSESHVIDLSIEGTGETHTCIVKDVQFDPTKYQPIHFDLLALRKGEKIKIEVSIIVAGNAPGVKEGGVLQHSLHKLEVECLPKDIPANIEVNVDELNIGDSIKVADLDEIPNITILADENASVVSVIAPRAEEEPVVAEDEEGLGEEKAEPEVIGKEGEDDSEGEDKKEDKGE